MKSIYNNDFAYLIGNFVADGSFYKDSSGHRFEFVDGSPYKNELIYSWEHLSRIKKIIEKFTKKNLPEIRKRGQMYRLSFRNNELASLFLDILGFLPGDKSRIIDIPNIYKKTKYEKYFWVGYLDGDGSIARKSKRVAVESMSQKIIESFAEYLDNLGIYFSIYESKRNNEKSYVVLIRSISFRDFVEKIGFNHPLKSRLLKEKMQKEEFFKKNNVDISIINNKINYIKIFDGSVFLENGRELLIKYGYTKYHRPNASIKEVVSLMRSKGLNDEDIIKSIGKYRFKKSKGSTNSVKLPITFDNELLKLARFVRIRDGGISFSKAYIESFNEDYNEILQLTEKFFDIKPKYTHKNEPLFCSGILSDVFNKIINKEK